MPISLSLSLFRRGEQASLGNTDVCQHDLATIVLLEKEARDVANARRALNVVIDNKIATQQCFEMERLTHNELLQRELLIDNERMKIIMRVRRATLRETKYL